VDDFKPVPAPETSESIKPPKSSEIIKEKPKDQLSRQELHKQYLKAKLKEIEGKMENDLRLRARMGRSQH
jgi:hypothetical protein